MIYNSTTDKLEAIIAAKDVSILNNVVTINPVHNLQYGTSYHVRISNNAFADSSGNYYAGIADDTIWQFTTPAAPDTTAPVLNTYSPANGATGVAIGANLELTFSEKVRAGKAISSSTIVRIMHQ